MNELVQLRNLPPVNLLLTKGMQQSLLFGKGGRISRIRNSIIETG